MDRLKTIVALAMILLGVPAMLIAAVALFAVASVSIEEEAPAEQTLPWDEEPQSLPPDEPPLSPSPDVTPPKPEPEPVDSAPVPVPNTHAGILSHTQILETVETNADTLTPCFRRALRRGEIERGRYLVRLDWVIQPDGRVSGARLAGPSGFFETSLPACVANALHGWRFPQSGSSLPVRSFALPIKLE